MQELSKKAMEQTCFLDSFSSSLSSVNNKTSKYIIMHVVTRRDLFKIF